MRVSTDPYEEEVIEERPVRREVVRRRYGPVGDPLSSIIGLIVVVIIVFVLLRFLNII